MSAEPTTSRASSPTAVPVWLPIMAPPIWRIMAASPPRPPPPPRAPSAWRSSSGTSSPSCAGSAVNMPLIASTPLAAIGSQSLAQTGKVASSHSDRLQASILRTPEGNAVASSSHRSASRTASVISRRCASRTLGSPAADDRVPGHVLGQIPVDRAAAVGQQVGELAQRVGELLRVAHRPERSPAVPAGRPGAGTPPGRPEPPDPNRTPGRPGLPAYRAGRSRTGGQPSLALRQDGRVMTVTLSREKHTVTNARRPVRHERSDALTSLCPSWRSPGRLAASGAP